MDFDSVDSFLKHVGVGRRSLDDPFFDDTYEACRVFRRTGITVEDEEDLCHRVMEEFQCSAPNCDDAFRNLADYEIHYNGSHRYACEECNITRPNARLLEIHIQETHDSFFDIVSQKRSMYQCYVTECDEKFASPIERKTHCAKIHRFPENFRYDTAERKNDWANFAKVERSREARITKKDPMEISEKIVPLLCFSERLCATENISSCDTSFENFDESSSERCGDYINCARQRLIDHENVETFVEERDTALEVEKFLSPLDQNIYSKILGRYTRGKKNILETDNLMDLLDELPN